MAINGPGFSIRFFFVDPKDSQVLRASSALIEGILARRRCVRDWAGMKIRSVRAAVIDSDGRKRLDHVAGCTSGTEGIGISPGERRWRLLSWS